MLIGSLEKGYGIRILLIELISLSLRTKGGEGGWFLVECKVFIGFSPKNSLKCKKKYVDLLCHLS